MAHRKLQQEIDRVFKKINEGLEIFDTYHERHENSTNSSQRDKLESDLKREIKKLQKLREQIKVWQTQNEVKDKDKLLDYRRLVESAMEKYKVVEKGSKVKAYSNMSLKQGADLDPEEKEKLDTIDFLRESIDDLDRQYQVVEFEVEKLSGKKSKKNSGANETKKNELKELQTRYRWHQQQLELALRLLENDELQVNDILEIKEELEYFLTSNRDPNFIENEYIYEALDLESNELLSNEVVSSFNGISVQEEKEEKKEKSISPKPATAQSQVKSSPVLPPPTSAPAVTTITSSQPAGVINTPKNKKILTTNTTPLVTTPSASSITPVSSTLKPAALPSTSVAEMNWSQLAAGRLNNNNDHHESPAPPNSAPAQVTTSSPNVPVTPTKAPTSAGSVTADTISTSIRQATSPIASGPPSSQPAPATLTNGVGTSVTVRSSISNTPPVNEIDYQQDSNLINLMPGIKDVIGSFISGRGDASSSPRIISNVGDLLRTPRDYLITRAEANPRSSNEYQRSNSLWMTACHEMNVMNQASILGSLDTSTLFYGFYFGLTPYENYIVERELIKRNWRADLAKKIWFQKKTTAPSSQHNEYEIASYNRFDSTSWSSGELINYRLAFNELARLPTNINIKNNLS